MENFQAFRKKNGFDDEHSLEDLCPICQEDLPAMGAGTTRSLCESCGKDICVNCLEQTNKMLEKYAGEMFAAAQRGDDRGIEKSAN